MARTYRVHLGTRMLNGAFAALTRLGLGAGYRHLLTVRGRKTGREHTVPVDVMTVGGTRFLVAPYGPTQWVKNARADPHVTLRRGRRSDRVRVAEVGPEESVPVLRAYLQEVAVARPYFGVRPDSPDEALAGEAPRHPVFRVEA